MEAGYPRELLTACHLHRRGEYPHDRARHSREGPLGDIALPRCHLSLRALRHHRPLRADGDDRADEGATLPTLRAHARETALISADESSEYICSVMAPLDHPRGRTLVLRILLDIIPLALMDTHRTCISSDSGSLYPPGGVTEAEDIRISSKF